MELVSILILVIAVIYLTKNAKGKQVVEHLGNTAVNLAASADDASAALHKQCRELLMTDEEATEAKAHAKAKLQKAEAIAEDYSDIL